MKIDKFETTKSYKNLFQGYWIEANSETRHKVLEDLYSVAYTSGQIEREIEIIEIIEKLENDYSRMLYCIIKNVLADIIKKIKEEKNELS